MLPRSLCPVVLLVLLHNWLRYDFLSTLSCIKGLLVVYKSILHFASFPIVCRIGSRHTPSHYNVGQTLSSQVCEDSYRLLLCPQNVQKGSATMCDTASILVVSSEIVNLVFCVNTLDIIMNQPCAVPTISCGCPVETYLCAF